MTLRLPDHGCGCYEDAPSPTLCALVILNYLQVLGVARPSIWASVLLLVLKETLASLKPISRLTPTEPAELKSGVTSSWKSSWYPQPPPAPRPN